jgi:predicted DNA-binding transcriptional regulator AlpA
MTGKWRIADDATDLLDTAAVAELAGVQPATIRGYLSLGYMPVPDVRLGQAPGWYRETIDRWLRSRPGQGHRTDLRDAKQRPATPE